MSFPISAAHYALIDEWLEEIVLYDLRIAGTGVEKRTDGRYEVVVRVAAAKTYGDGVGGEHPVPMNEAIEVGVFRSHPDNGLDPPLNLTAAPDA